jgi:hypothetical protein
MSVVDSDGRLRLAINIPAVSFEVRAAYFTRRNNLPTMLSTQQDANTM